MKVVRLVIIGLGWIVSKIAQLISQMVGYLVLKIVMDAEQGEYLIRNHAVLGTVLGEMMVLLVGVMHTFLVV
jgi:hypothetical protein